MSKWRVCKLVKPNGNVPFDKWYNSLSTADKAAVDETVMLIESVTTLPPEKVKKYKELYELKIYGNKVALRPLALKDGKGRKLIVLVGTTKKGAIPDHEYKAALKLAKSHDDGDCGVKGYWET